MGFFSFLLRKPASHNDLALRGQSYDATVAAQPPILGTVPVAGNGANILERLQQRQPPNNNNVDIDSSAPPPIIPRLRSDHVERPKTAPSKPAKRQGPLYRLPSKIWSTSSSELKRSSLIPPMPAFVHQERSSSISSSGSRGFVNLLDAQSEIKSPDFRSRVKATGAREYDEDVADRNLHMFNDLNAAAAQDPYYTKDVSATSTDIYNILNGDPSRQPRKRHSLAMGMGMGTESLVTSSQGAYSKRGSHHVLEAYSPSDDHALGAFTNRRNSIPSFVAPSSSTLRPRSSSKHTKLQDLDTHAPSMPQWTPQDAHESDSDVATEASSSSIKISRSPRNNRSATTKYPNDQISELGLHRRHDKPVESVTPWEVTDESAKSTSRRPKTQYAPDLTVVTPLPKRQSLQNFHSPKGRDHVRDRTPRKVTSMDNAKPVQGVRSRPNVEAPPALRTSLFSNFDQSSPSEERTDLLDLDELLRRARARAQSIASPSVKSAKASSIEEFVPERGSSLRNSSLTSETTRYSSLGSSSFRPQSRHTPSTSIDLTPTVPFFNFTNTSQNTVFKGNNSSSPKAQVRRSNVVSSSVESISTVHGREEDQSVLDIDEFSSSSEDSFENPHKPRGQREKELLFIESGFGISAAPLPGLPGLSEAATSRPTTAQSAQVRIQAFHSHSPANSMSGESDDGEDQPDFTSSYPAQLLEDMHSYQSNMFRNSAFNHAQGLANDEEFVQQDEEEEEEIEESSDDEICFDIPRSRTNTMRYSSSAATHGQHRYETAVGSNPIDEEGDDSDEEGDDAVDISALMRSRKELKAKQRESGSASAAAAVQRAQGVRRLSAMKVDAPPIDDRSRGYHK